MNRVCNVILYFISVVTAFSNFFYFSKTVYLIIFLQFGIFLYFFIRGEDFSIHTLYWVFFTIALLFFPCPYLNIGTLTAYIAIVFITSKYRARFSWLRLGKLDKQTLIISAMTVLITSVALNVWHAIARPVV